MSPRRFAPRASGRQAEEDGHVAKNWVKLLAAAWTKLLRLAEPRGPKPPHAEARNSQSSFLDPAGFAPTNPAPGYRDFGRTGWEGIARSIGDHGYSLSSATSGIYGMDLYSRSQYLNTSFSDHRAHGFQLRCLSE